MRERREVSANELTTFKIGGNARLLYEPEDLDSLLEILGQNDSFHIIGNGSNVVFSDLGISKPIIHLVGAFNNWHFVNSFPEKLSLDLAQVQPYGKEALVLSFAANSLMRLSSQLTNLSYTGLEFAAGIPGTIGGAIAMNAGAHGHEISEIVEVVYLIGQDRQIKKLNREQINFNYRSSGLTGVIVAAGLRLQYANKEQIISNRKSCLEYRKSTQPLTLPSAGSVFINFKDNQGNITYVASLLEQLGLKGLKVGGVQFSPMHANWLVKISEHAKTEDFIQLINLAKSKVKENYGIDLTTEIKFWE